MLKFRSQDERECATALPSKIPTPSLKKLSKYCVKDQLKRVFSRIKIEPDVIVKLYASFRKIDTNNNGTISYKEFFDSYAFTYQPPLQDLTFRAFDYDGSGELDFGEFAISMWNYCTCTYIELASFFFDIFDDDGTKSLTDRQMFDFLTSAYGSIQKMPRIVRNLTKKFETTPGVNDVGGMTKYEFLDFAKHNKTVFFPMQVLQKELCNVIGSERYWAAQADRRRKKWDKLKPDLSFLRNMFSDECYFKFVQLNVHGAIDCEPIAIGCKRAGSLPSLFVKCKVRGRKKYRMGRTSIENPDPRWEFTVNIQEAHVDDKIILEVYNYTLPFRLPFDWRPPFARELYATATFKVRSLVQKNCNRKREVKMKYAGSNAGRASGALVISSTYKHLDDKDTLRQNRKRPPTPEKQTWREKLTKTEKSQGIGTDKFVLNYLNELND